MKKAKSFVKGITYSHVVICLVLLSMQLHAQPSSHDPCNVMRDSNRYWVFYTHDGIGAISASSPDFSDWQNEPTVFGDTWPSWINSYVPAFAGQFWAPACIYMNNKYYLYYSCSTMGSSLSAIGVATTPSLNDSAWTDQGIVVSSNGSVNGNLNNAIDPAIFKDDDGSAWMTYGSWFGGIAIIEIDSLTGKTKGSLTQLVGGNHQDYEASYLMKHEDYYYLFVNRANCCNGVNSTYYIQVGRSTNITGPYGDWRTFLQTDGRYIGPGHFGYREGRLTYHIYDRDDDGAAKLMNTTLEWIDGWPVAFPVPQDVAAPNFVDGVYRIYTSDSSKIVGVNNNTPSVGANVQICEYTDPGIAGQSWTISNTCFNNYKVSPQNYATLGFDVYNCVIDDGANIGLWSYWGGACQQWSFYKMDNGLYQIKSRNSNKCMEIEGASIAEGANVFQNSCDTGNQKQHFKLELLELDEPDEVDSFPRVISFTSEQCGNPASNIVDGNTTNDSRWSTYGFPKTAIIDFGEVKSFVQAKVWTYQSRAYQYTIDLNEDLNFTGSYRIDRRSNTTTSQPIIDNFEPKLARYVRLTVTGASNASVEWVSITEIELVEGTSGTESIFSNNTDLVLYPNPVKNVLHIELPAGLSNNARVKVYNAIGQVVFNQSDIKGTIATLNLTGLANGIYSIKVSNNEFSATKRFIKQ